MKDEKDRGRLIREADVPCLMMAYVHATGDFELMERFRPHVRRIYE